MGKHILVVDDSKTIRNLVAFVLKAEGFKVTTAEDGLDGLEKLYAMEAVLGLFALLGSHSEPGKALPCGVMASAAFSIKAFIPMSRPALHVVPFFVFCRRGVSCQFAVSRR